MSAGESTAYGMKSHILNVVVFVAHWYGFLLLINLGLGLVGDSDLPFAWKEAFGYSLGFGLALGLSAGILAVFDKRVSWGDGLFCGLLIGFTSGVSGAIVLNSGVGLLVALTGFLACILVFSIFFTVRRLSGT